MNNRILLVDDDTNVLSGYKRVLHKTFSVATASSGGEGINLLKSQEPFAVIVADYRMPEMDGIQLLARARQIAPDTVRVMLTGQADLQATINAINEGDIFRFLTKPCPRELFLKTILAAQEQYRLITSERELLGKTLHGSIKILIDILSAVNPVALSRSSRLKELARIVASRLSVPIWEVQLAALLSQIGCVTVPGSVLEKMHRGTELLEEEAEMFLAHPQTGRQFLDNIPRLENIAEAIAYQFKQFDGGGLPDDGKKGDSIPVLARVLKVLIDFDTLLQSGKTDTQALEIMRSHRHWYDPRVLASLEAGVRQGEFASPKPEFVAATVAIKDIVSGVILADDVCDNTGKLLLAKGREISEVMKMRLLNLSRLGAVAEPIKIFKQIN